MNSYKKVNIDIMENGYTVTVVLPEKDKGKKFVFDKCKKMKDWLKDNLAATGEVERFSDALDDKKDNNEKDAIRYRAYFDPSISTIATTTNITTT